MYPVLTRTGIQVISTNLLLLENETDPVIWRGPIISGVVQQFWTDVLWNCDYLFCGHAPGHRRRVPCPCSSPSPWTAS